MSIVRKALNCMIVFALCNIIFFWNMVSLSIYIKIIFTLLFLVLFIVINVSPSNAKNITGKLKTLGNGYNLLVTALACAALQIIISILLIQLRLYDFTLQVWIANSILSFIIINILLINGAIRIFISSKQVTLRLRIIYIFLWWIPVANLIMYLILIFVARDEYRFNLLKYNKNQNRKMLQICKTKYPLLLVHGIFFRDWKAFNYWGRIPAELEQNGATIYYGQQQSSSTVEASAAELKDQILRIINDSGCKKVNIIAHSKGGLDSRYAISCLGMDEYIASLTTINTPHRGCTYAKKALDKIPQKAVTKVSKNYNKIFTKLGDGQPDFFNGVSDLTDEKCRQLNVLMPDSKKVLYQSIGSKIGNKKSALPLKIGSKIINTMDGANDGLVAVDSMPWGQFTMLESTGKHGISHADVIDLTRKNIKGFDVCELYVNIVQRLKEQGL